MNIEIDVAYLRTLGNLPENLPEAQLLPHLTSAVSMVKALLGDREPKDAVEEERVRTAMGCFAMAYALPVLNTFYLSQAEKVPRQVALTDYVFHEPGDVLKLAAYWKNRAYEELREVGRTGGAGVVGVSVI
ncbi:MAG: hypothetical protein LBQ90_05090 [Synergistaceae bacterium]|jgi:hypothetical protein|nr:hypothetical protein [Synergistaceae bacterium]